MCCRDCLPQFPLLRWMTKPSLWIWTNQSKIPCGWLKNRLNLDAPNWVWMCNNQWCSSLPLVFSTSLLDQALLLQAARRSFEDHLCACKLPHACMHARTHVHACKEKQLKREDTEGLTTTPPPPLRKWGAVAAFVVIVVVVEVVSFHYSGARQPSHTSCLNYRKCGDAARNNARQKWGRWKLGYQYLASSKNELQSRKSGIKANKWHDFNNVWCLCWITLQKK